MKLFAKKPCQFGGNKFFIGDEIPVELVSEPNKQERLGVVTIVSDDGTENPGGQPGALYTQEQVDNMIATAVETATAEIQQAQDELQQVVAELRETESGAYKKTIQIAVKGESSGENGQEQNMMIPATPEEIQQAFSIMQLNADEGTKAIADVTSENVLILLHASDSRKAVKKAAKEQADNLFSTNAENDESGSGNASTDTYTEGADT